MAAKDNSAKTFDLMVEGTARDLGELQFSVLTAVAERRYSEAVDHLERYKEFKGRLKIYARKTENTFKHAADLIHAIEAKKTFPNLNALPQSKQEELHQKALENWESLKVCLRRLRTIEKDIAMADARSSIWVIKAVIFSFMIVMSVWVLNEAFRMFGQSLTLFLDETARMILDFFSNIFQ